MENYACGYTHKCLRLFASLIIHLCMRICKIGLIRSNLWPPELIFILASIKFFFARNCPLPTALLARPCYYKKQRQLYLQFGVENFPTSGCGRGSRRPRAHVSQLALSRALVPIRTRAKAPRRACCLPSHGVTLRRETPALPAPLPYRHSAASSVDSPGRGTGPVRLGCCCGVSAWCRVWP